MHATTLSEPQLHDSCRRYPKDDHEMFDLKYIIKASSTLFNTIALCTNQQELYDACMCSCLGVKLITSAA